MESKSPANHIRVLYVDDEEANLEAFKAAFRRTYNVNLAESAWRAKEILSNEEIHVLITDQRMPNATGVELLEFAVQKYPKPIRILLTAFADIEALEAAINRGRIFKYFKKPWNEDELHLAIIEAFELYKLREERDFLLNELRETSIGLNRMTETKLGIVQLPFKS